MELIFNPYSEFRWSPEDPISQVHSPLLHVGAPGIFSDLWRPVKMLNRECGCGKQYKAIAPIQSLVKLQPRFLNLQGKTCLWAELQPWCLSLQWRTLMMIYTGCKRYRLPKNMGDTSQSTYQKSLIQFCFISYFNFYVLKPDVFSTGTVVCLQSISCVAPFR